MHWLQCSPLGQIIATVILHFAFTKPNIQFWHSNVFIRPYLFHNVLCHRQLLCNCINTIIICDNTGIVNLVLYEAVVLMFAGFCVHVNVNSHGDTAAGEQQHHPAGNDPQTFNKVQIHPHVQWHWARCHMASLCVDMLLSLFFSF